MSVASSSSLASSRQQSRRSIASPRLSTAELAAAAGRETFTAAFNERIDALRGQIEALKEHVEGQLRAREENLDWADWGAPAGEAAFDLRVRRTLDAHRARVYALGWASDNVTLATASIDGKVIVWDAYTRVMRGLAVLATPWVMTVAFDREESEYLLTAGVDAAVSIFNARELCDAQPSVDVTRPRLVLRGHAGYVTAARFLSTERVVSASGDGTLRLWDTHINQQLATFTDHAADVTAVSAHPHDPFMVATASADATLRLWDLRSREDEACVRTFSGFESDATGVEIFRNGLTVAGCAGDSTLRLFDMRSTAPVGIYTDSTIKSAASALTVSASGRLVVVAYERNEAVAWEVVSSDGAFHELASHSARVSCLSMNSSGQALATGSWDKRVAIWC